MNWFNNEIKFFEYNEIRILPMLSFAFFIPSKNHFKKFLIYFSVLQRLYLIITNNKLYI